jgi:hypothetical protein
MEDNLTDFDSILVRLDGDEGFGIPIELCDAWNGTGNKSLNVTCLEHAPELTTAAITRTVVLSFMAFFSLVGNLLTIQSIKRTRLSNRSRSHSWSAVYALILHLSVADLLVTIFCISGNIYNYL